jgi:diketogulonate reductase-like aldo/keto reductase|uniref:Aldo/keto reductase n=1 Tax=Ignisphaera aggregans TaxID=334771 RepID=A0A7J3YTH8_9CREN
MAYLALDYSDRKPLGKTSEKVTVLGLGTLNIRDFIDAEKALLKAVELGLNVIEVSDSYALGLSMDLIKKILTNIKRDELFIVFRVSPIILSDPSNAVARFEQLLRKMNTSFVDVLMPAGYVDFISLDAEVKALENIADKGLTRHLGLSGFKVKQIANVLHMLRKHDIVMVQSRYSVLNKRIEKDLIPFAVKTGITVQACTTLEEGHVLRHPVVLQIASKYGKTAAQVALSYVIARSHVVALTKSERIDHIVEDKEAINLRLGEEDLNKLSMI